METKSYPAYEPLWVTKLPEIGTQCPKCKKGYIEGNNFKSKKGVQILSNKCEVCLTKWLISTWEKPDSTTARPIEVVADKTQERLEMIYKAILDIKAIVTNIETNLIAKEIPAGEDKDTDEFGN